MKTFRKVIKEDMKTIMDDDIKMDQTMEFLSKVLLGNFHGRAISEDTLNSWFQQHWSLILGFVLVFHILSKWVGLPIQNGVRFHDYSARSLVLGFNIFIYAIVVSLF